MKGDWSIEIPPKMFEQYESDDRYSLHISCGCSLCFGSHHLSTSFAAMERECWWEERGTDRRPLQKDHCRTLAMKCASRDKRKKEKSTFVMMLEKTRTERITKKKLKNVSPSTYSSPRPEIFLSETLDIFRSGGATSAERITKNEQLGRIVHSSEKILDFFIEKCSNGTSEHWGKIW